MNEEIKGVVATAPGDGSAVGASEPTLSVQNARILRSLCVTIGVIAVVFCKPLYELVRLALKEEFHSHIPLIPFITGYLIFLDKDRVKGEWKSSKGLAVGMAAMGVVVWISFLLFSGKIPKLATQDVCFWQMAGILPFIYAAGFYWVGAGVMSKLAFPVGFLLFLLPVPLPVEHVMATFLQHISADAAYFFIHSSGTPVLRNELLFQLPGISIVVAEECSGIRSSFVLFITSLIAGHLYLRSWFAKSILGLAVLPLAVLRNGFRIFTLAMLTVHVDKSLIDSAIHHRGGPIFFALSLIPFFGILWWLRKREHRSEKSSKP